MFIDLISDTVTKPTAKMLQAMFNAKVGDDIFGEDPTINELEQKTAELFGMEAGIFCPSGTMTNQIAIKVHTKPGDDIICAEKAHIYQYEGGGIAFNAGCSVGLIPADDGKFGVKEFLQRIQPDDIHKPQSTLLEIENTTNKGGGAIWKFEEMKALSVAARENGIAFHMDGARFFNAHVEEKYDLKAVGGLFDSISICLSKGLGAPVGSVLIGSKVFIKQARRIRKVFGGGMRQAGYLAAAGIYALNNNIERLKTDNDRAKELASILSNKPFVKKAYPVHTNILIFQLREEVDDKAFIQSLSDKGVRGILMGKNLIRFVLHLDVSEDHFIELKRILKDL